MTKRGISAIVATVLILLITIAGVTIIWRGILPMFSGLGASSTENTVSIDTNGGYTLYDDRQKIACVQVKRESSLELEGLKILFSVEGNSYFGFIGSEDIPDLNQKKTYCFSLKNFGKPEMVSVVSLPEGIMVSSVMPMKSLSNDAIGSIVGDGEGSSSSQIRYLEGDRQILLTDCAVLNKTGGIYLLQNDVVTTGICFNITADNIILEGNGFNITSVNDELFVDNYGVYSEGHSNLTIRNAVIYNFDDEGIFLKHSNNNILKDVSLIYNSDGIVLNDCSNNFITNITAYGSFWGIVLIQSSNSRIENVNLKNHLKGSIILFPGSNRNVLKKILSAGNADSVVLSSGSDNLIIDSNLSDLGYNVVAEESALNNTFTNVSYLREDVDGTSQIIRKWYYSAYVNDSSGNSVGGASILVRNQTQQEQFSLISGSNGLAGTAEIIDYINNGGVTGYYSSYNISASYQGYETVSLSWNVTLQHNNQQDFQLA